MSALIALRTLLVVLCALTGSLAGNVLGGVPWGASGAAIGVVVALAVFGLERQFRKTPLRVVTGALAGLAAGLIVGNLAGYAFLLGRADQPRLALLAYFTVTLLAGYLGLRIGTQQGSVFKREGGETEEAAGVGLKILDTSAIIDGRIADICDTAFIEGTIIIPQFILQELQYVADSYDPSKRARGRRGLDILKRIQGQQHARVSIIERDFSQIKEIDAKLVALGQALGAKIITNDFNLNKVAELQGVQSLNINDLANALRPVVLPGELMNVHVLREGKEAGQGVAYLEDGTMVVVDNAKRYIGRSIDVTVTSVLQTTAGRMIFSRLKEE
ncbi:MAG: PIN/TRAM domain-containing protein [Myxococcota bacterium]